MIDIEKELAEKGLTREKYQELLTVCEKKVEGLIDKDWSEISEEFGLGWTGDSLRRVCRTSLLGFAFVKQYMEESFFENKVSDSDTFQDQRRELEQLKIQYRDERNAWQKQNRSKARLDELMSIMSDELKTIGRSQFTEAPQPVLTSNKELIVMLSDLHIGKCFDNSVGRYDSDIAKIRLNDYLCCITEICNENDINRIHVFSLGDQINGNIHRSLAITNRENVIEQVKTASTLIANFVEDLCELGKRVDFYSVNGNHSRITQNKNDELRDERLDNMVCWIVSQILANNANFYYHEEFNIDSGLVSVKINGKDYVAVHGDFDNTNDANVSKICFMTGTFPEAILRGHYHTPGMNMVSGIQVIQSGSLDGSGDDYTMSKRIIGFPSQTCVIVSPNGVESIHNIKLGG